MTTPIAVQIVPTSKRILDRLHGSIGGPRPQKASTSNRIRSALFGCDVRVAEQPDLATRDHLFHLVARECASYASAVGSHVFVTLVADAAHLRRVERWMLDHQPLT